MGNNKYPTLFFISSNNYKYDEFKSLLNLADLKMANRNVLEIQTSLMDVLVKRKAEDIQPSMPGLPFFVEHTGLEIRALKGLPGGLTSEFMKTVGNEGICRMLQAWPNERAASAVSVIGYSAPNGQIEIFRGETTGSIVTEPRGKGGFGWDAIFLPDGHVKTFAEMPADEKNRISMRRISSGKFFLTVLKQHFELASQLADEVLEESKPGLNVVKLHGSILNGFDENELQDLFFYLQIEYTDIPGDTRRDKARELILYLNRRGRIDELIELCRGLRPKIDWDVGGT